jgi:acyl carrier protein
VIRRETVLADVIGILETLSGDWELESEIREGAYLLGELGLESIDAVALGTAIEEKYQRAIPYVQFLLQLEQNEVRDFTVGEFVDFITEELNSGAKSTSS